MNAAPPDVGGALKTLAACAFHDVAVGEAILSLDDETSVSPVDHPIVEFSVSAKGSP